MSAHAEANFPPAHVPADLVRTFPFILGNLTSSNPFRKMVHDIHRTAPPIFYVSDVYPGGTPGWVVRKAKDLRAIFGDSEHFSVKDFAPFARMIGESWSMVPVEIDPPLHGQFRELLNPLFTAASLRKLDEKVATAAQRLADTFKDDAEIELRGAFAVPFPVSIILDLLDLPQERMQEFMAWEHGLLHDPNMANLQRATANVVGLFRELIKERRVRPGEDLVSFAVHAKLGNRLLTEDEIVGFCFNLFIGGLDTVTTNITWQFRHLAENPEQQRQLRENPALIPNAMQEMLRAYSSVSTFRTCIKEVIIGGVTFMPGDKIMMSTTLGSNDPEEFPNPEQVLFERRSNHLAFGTGAHFCIGRLLAQREMSTALTTLLTVLPEFRLKPDAEILTDLGGVMQPRSLPLLLQ